MARPGISDVSTAVGSGRGAAPPRGAPALTIVAHPSAQRIGDRLVLDAVAEGRELSVSRNAPDFAAPGHALGAPLGDPFVSRRPIRFAPGRAGGVRVIAEDAAAPIVDGARATDVELSAAQVAHGVALELGDRIVLWLHAFERGDAAGERLGMVGDSAGLRAVRAAIERVVDLDVPVLIRGETGTGKELVARALHERGARRAAPFVSVNLGAMPRELAAAELFGVVRGAYTGATRDRDGLFRAAHGGTLFLDEVGEAPPEIQASLLRVLETGEVYAVGSDQPSMVDIRLITATDAALEDHIRDGRFKAPLLHRLAGYEIRIPPLRERRDDIGRLFVHFARAELAAIGELSRLSPDDPYAPPWLPSAIAVALVRHAWPGNLRQLRNVVRQLVIGCRGLAQLRLDPVLAELAPPASATPPATPPVAPVRRKPSEVGEAELLDALRACAWDLKAAADRLHIPRPSIYDLIERSPHVRTAGSLTADELAASFAACRGELDAMAAQLQVSRRALQRRIKELGLVRPPDEDAG